MIPGRVSVIIPVHNRPELLPEAVDSALGQSHDDVEIIVVDDGSTDTTAAVAAGLAGDHPDRLRLIRQPCRGPGPARQRGLEAARGEFVQYLDSDDLLMPRKFEVEIDALFRTPEAHVCYGGTRRYRRGERPATLRAQDFIRHTARPVATLYPSVLRGRLWATSTPLFRRSVLEAAPAWAALIADEDWLHDLELGLRGARLVHVPEHVCDMRDHDGPQLHRAPGAEQQRWRDRARARLQMIEGIAECAPLTPPADLEHFTRSGFLLARQCAARDLLPESRTLLAGLSRLGPLSGRLGAYRAVSRVIGDGRTGRACEALDRVRARWRGIGGAVPPPPEIRA